MEGADKMAKNNLEHPCRIPGTDNWRVRVQQSQSVKCPRVLRSPKLILAISKVFPATTITFEVFFFEMMFVNVKLDICGCQRITF